MEMNILLTGGSGRLGKELQKINKFKYIPSHNEMDITDIDSVNSYIKNKTINLIVHCAAIPNTDSKKIDQTLLYNTNVIGTRNLLNIAPILFISTEYVFNGKKGNYKESDRPEPLNYYGQTKLLAEKLVNDQCGVVIRSGRVSLNPWPYNVACYDMYTSGDYIDVMAAEINLAINLFDALPDIIHIGTKRKSVLDLAKRTKPDVKEISRSKLDSILPYDCSFNINLWNSIKKQNNY